MDVHPQSPTLGGPGAPAPQPVESVSSRVIRLLEAIEARQASIEDRLADLDERVEAIADAVNALDQDRQDETLSEIQDAIRTLANTVDDVQLTLGNVDSTVDDIQSTVGNIEGTVDAL